MASGTGLLGLYAAITENSRRRRQMADAQKAYEARLAASTADELKRNQLLNDMYDSELMKAAAVAHPDKDPNLFVAQYKLAHPELLRSNTDTQIAKNLVDQAKARGSLQYGEQIGSSGAQKEIKANEAVSTALDVEKEVKGAERIFKPRLTMAIGAADEAEADLRADAARRAQVAAPVLNQAAISGAEADTRINRNKLNTAAAEAPFIEQQIKDKAATEAAQAALARKQANFQGTALDATDPRLQGQAENAAAQGALDAATLQSQYPLLNPKLRIPNYQDMMSPQMKAMMPLLSRPIRPPVAPDATNSLSVGPSSTKRTLFKFNNQ